MNTTRTDIKPSDRVYACNTLLDASRKRREEALAEADRLAADRRNHVLAGNVDHVTQTDRAIEAANQIAQREARTIEELERELAKATSDEAAATAWLGLERARAARARGATLIHEQYPKAARKLAELAAGLVAIERCIEEANQQALAAGLDKADIVLPLNHERTRPPKVTPAHTQTREVPDTDAPIARVTGHAGGTVESRYRSKSVTVEVPESVEHFRPPYDTLTETLNLPPARDGEYPFWSAEAPAYREAVANAAALVDAMLK